MPVVKTIRPARIKVKTGKTAHRKAGRISEENAEGTGNLFGNRSEEIEKLNYLLGCLSSNFLSIRILKIYYFVDLKNNAAAGVRAHRSNRFFIVNVLHVDRLRSAHRWIVSVYHPYRPSNGPSFVVVA